MPVKRETDFVYPAPVDQDWVRVQLLQYGTTCESLGCKRQAVYAHVADRTAVYLCDMHKTLLLSRPAFARQFERRMVPWFQELFSFYSQAAATFGDLLVQIEERQADEAAAAKKQKADAQKAEAQFHRALRQYNKEEFADVKVGAPEDGLVASRGGSPTLGAQSAPRSAQPVLRIAELESIGPVILPPSNESGLLFVPRLL